jgi:hypothetical protein
MTGFFNKYRKIIIVILFLAVCSLLGFFIYRLFFKPATQIIPTTAIPGTSIGGLPGAGEGGQQIATTTGPGGIPISPGIITPTGPSSPISGVPAVSTKAQGGLTKTTAISSSPGLGTILSADGQTVQYYNQVDGKFYKINANGEAVPLTDKIFHNVQNIEWSPNSEKAVLEYPDGSKITYDFKTNKQATLPKHWQDFSFSPDSNQLVLKSIGLDVENRWLAVANTDGTQARALEYIGANGDKVYNDWSPNGQTAAMYVEGLDFSRQELFFVGLNGENFKSTIIEGRGFDPLWSEKGDKLLYSVYSAASDLKPRLWIVNAQGDNIGTNRQALEVETWADKCTFASNSEIYCAVPDNLESGAGLLPELANKTQDSLYKIDLTTGTKKLIAIPDGKYNISDLIISDGQSKLYFTDATTKQIYKIDLK